MHLSFPVALIITIFHVFVFLWFVLLSLSFIESLWVSYLSFEFFWWLWFLLIQMLYYAFLFISPVLYRGTGVTHLEYSLVAILERAFRPFFWFFVFLFLCGDGIRIYSIMADPFVGCFLNTRFPLGFALMLCSWSLCSRWFWVTAFVCLLSWWIIGL